MTDKPEKSKTVTKKEVEEKIAARKAEIASVTAQHQQFANQVQAQHAKFQQRISHLEGMVLAHEEELKEFNASEPEPKPDDPRKPESNGEVTRGRGRPRKMAVK